MSEKIPLECNYGEYFWDLKNWLKKCVASFFLFSTSILFFVRKRKVDKLPVCHIYIVQKLVTLMLNHLYLISYLLYSVVVEFPLRVREVYGSNPSEAESYQIKNLKMVLTAFLCDAPHINEFELGK